MAVGEVTEYWLERLMAVVKFVGLEAELDEQSYWLERLIDVDEVDELAEEFGEL